MKRGWNEVYTHEISRRRRIAKENKELFINLHKANPKRLLYEADCLKHCWVPLTHLMIHDGGKKSCLLHGINRRAFIEAYPYKRETVSIVPQMCWYCDATRELEIGRESTEERLKRLKALRPKSKKGRQGAVLNESLFDELFF